MVIKVCLSIFCYDRNIRWDDRNIYGSHQNNELSRFEEHTCIMLKISKHCFYMLHKGAYKVNLISGSLILKITVAIILV